MSNANNRYNTVGRNKIGSELRKTGEEVYAHQMTVLQDIPVVGATNDV